MKIHKPTSNPNKIIAAMMPTSIHNSVSGLFASGIAISYSFADGGVLRSFSELLMLITAQTRKPMIPPTTTPIKNFNIGTSTLFFGARGSYSVSAPGAVSVAVSSAAATVTGA